MRAPHLWEEGGETGGGGEGVGRRERDQGAVIHPGLIKKYFRNERSGRGSRSVGLVQV